MTAKHSDMDGPRPNVFIVGAPKSGTTFMHEFLQAHPAVFMPKWKEPHFFGRDMLPGAHPRLGLKLYLSLYAGSERFRWRGDSSIFYLGSQSAAEEISRFTSEARVIVMLRDPVEMMHALHSQLVYAGYETIIDFERALAAEDDRRRGRRVPAGAWFRDMYFYRHIANYAEHLERYRGVFGDRVHAIVYDDLRRDPLAVCRGVERFLGIEEVGRVPGIVNANRRIVNKRLHVAAWQALHAARVVPRSMRLRIVEALNRVNAPTGPREAMPPATRERLSAELAPSVRRLSAALGRDLSGWCAADFTRRAPPPGLSGAEGGGSS